MIALLALMLALVSGTALAAQPLGYLAFGDLRGYLEPCGCDPATDLGGVHRLKEVVERERRTTPSLLLFSLGNILPKKGEKTLKNPFLLEAAAAVKPTAYLWNETEAAQPEAAQAFRGKIPFVLSNAKAKSPWSGLAAEVIDDPAALIFGYVRTPSLMATTEPVGPALIARWKKILAKAGDRPKILLFAGSAADLEALAKTNKLFDFVISSNAAALDALPGTAEKENEKLLERAPFGPVFQVPLGGQGVLRGGTLMFEGGKSIGDLLAGKPKDPLFAAAHVVTWLPKSIGGDDQLKDLFSRYNDAAKAQFAAAGAARLADLNDSPYAGAEACATCHPAAQKVWQDSKHAHAMATLQKKNKHEDPECVACHVVGATAKGGFVSLEHSPKLANVQCENCHGPRKDHAQNPTIKSTVKAADACKSCHNPLHSPSFDAKVYWSRIAHGK